MEIEGDIAWIQFMGGPEYSGAFESEYKNTQQSAYSGNTTVPQRIKFKASKNWTGETSSFGLENPNNFFPPSYAVEIWVRLS